ncbi:hypothetical protein ALC62_14163 [Cyphomyrmex costatus]|uniref:Uncharacterized protein n=1 Tax=Cyphomyrmex costatus TaxID=456900 RepID=A0A195C336_9HYME|nr:hypothetical protein ALC62_14163 [Cyphomyrmex costatus]
MTGPIKNGFHIDTMGNYDDDNRSRARARKVLSVTFTFSHARIFEKICIADEIESDELEAAFAIAKPELVNLFNVVNHFHTDT